MRRFSLRLGLSVLGAALLAVPAAAQTQPARDTRPAQATASGDTGLFFVPTAEVLPAKRFSFSLYRTNIDDGQGFSDISHFPVTLGFGVSNRVELFAAMNAVYARRFAAPYPARTTVCVAGLPLGADVELELVARIPTT